MGNEEIAHNKQLLLFATVFFTLLENFAPFSSTLNCRLQTLSFWNSLKFVIWDRVKNLNGLHNHIFQDSFNKSLSQQLSHERTYVSQTILNFLLKRRDAELIDIG